MSPTITAFERSPDRGRGLARDMRVRWALEEVGQPYDVRLLSFGEMKEAGQLFTRTASATLTVLPSAGVTGVKGRFVTPEGGGFGDRSRLTG